MMGGKYTLVIYTKQNISIKNISERVPCFLIT